MAEISKETQESANAQVQMPEKDKTETILFDGILGFAFSLGNAMLVFLGSAFYCEDLYLFSALACIMTIVIAVSLKVIQFASDTVQSTFGRRLTIGIYVISMIGSLVAGCLDVSVVAIVLAGVCFVATLILYAGFLASLPRTALMIVVDVLLIYIGVMFILATQVTQPYARLIHAIAVLISIAFTITFLTRDVIFREVISAKDSKKNSIPVRGNVQTLVLVGFMLGASLAAFYVAKTPTEAVITIGSAIFAAGLFSSLMHAVEERAYKELLKKIMALYSCLLLVVPLVPHTAKLVVIGVYVFLVCLNVVIVANAVIESARFNIVSPVWQIGKEGCAFFCGCIISVALYFAADALQNVYSNALTVAFILTVVICSVIQIGVNYQVYPFEPVIDKEPDAEIEAEVAQAGKRKALWHSKIEATSQQYHLSPREIEVLNILLKGRDTKYIMDKFCISQSTAKTHIYNIYRKLGIHSRQELIDFVEDIRIPEQTNDSE